MLLKRWKVPDKKKQISYSDFTQNICSSENPVKQAKTLTPVDLRRVLDFIATRPHSVRNRAMLLMTYYSGMRVGEVASLRYSDIVDPDKTIRSEIILRPDQTKGNESRTVFISEKLKKELDAYVKATKFTDPFDKFFYTQKRVDEGFNANTLTQHFHHLYKRAGIAGASSHSGRRSFITNLASKGISVRVLASLAGHKSIATTQRYIDVNDDQKRRAVELI
jgi:integrase/recombinase XerD